MAALIYMLLRFCQPAVVNPYPLVLVFINNLFQSLGAFLCNIKHIFVEIVGPLDFNLRFDNYLVSIAVPDTGYGYKTGPGFQPQNGLAYGSV